MLGGGAAEPLFVLVKSLRGPTLGRVLMSRTCAKCGTAAAPEARFCRHCGALLRVAESTAEHGPVSPLAQTVPLSSDALTTSGLGSDETGRPAPETKRVGRTEIEHLLRRSPLRSTDETEAALHSSNPARDYGAPPTATLAPASATPVQPQAPARSTGRISLRSRGRLSPAPVIALILLVTLTGGLLAYYFVRQRTSNDAGNIAIEANTNQSAEPQTADSSTVNAEARDSGTTAPAAPETSPSPSDSASQSQPQATPTPKPSATTEPAREARAKQQRDEEATGTLTTAMPTPPASSAATSPQSQSTSAPQAGASPSAASSTNSTTAAQPKQGSASADSFYFQAVNIVNGRDPRTLQRAELLRALQLFQNVKGGSHAEDAVRQAERLGRELDRRRRSGIPN